ncbi:Uncharacterised protein [Vibrio cholerae]|nr:Uncharacterised protein [Vibrio cholerae]CSC48608.1 Uncharacterised protein [Vibrio cholerae]
MPYLVCPQRPVPMLWRILKRCCSLKPIVGMCTTRSPMKDKILCYSMFAVKPSMPKDMCHVPSACRTHA